MYSIQSRTTSTNGNIPMNRGNKRPDSPIVTGEPIGDGVRAELVARVRAEIAAGTYDTAERWDAALDALADRLR